MASEFLEKTEENVKLKEFLVISYGTFSLSETENKNQFYFYRNDGEVLTEFFELDL